MKSQLHRLLCLSLLAAACLYTYRLDDSETHTYAARGIRELGAETRNGDISVTATLDSVITVEVQKYAYGRDKADAELALRNLAYSDTVIGTRLVVKESMPDGSRPYGANFTITAPESIGLFLATTNGDVTVQNMVGGISATTTNGKVELTGTAGTASVSTTNGKLDVKVHSGAFYGATTNSAVDCDLAALSPTEDVGLATTNGKVTLLLPEDVSAVLEATNTNGILTIYDFTVVYDVQEEHHLRARIGSGASTINVTTTNGDIVIRRRS
ncbi:DUF4097 family beta strand repeat protein [candidate division WOR-3 bacterium]|nr:DUF4097 family beta strand repeat protein [candidate division WOR-3 bacterium]